MKSMIKQRMKQILSYLLCISMIAPSMAPIISEAAIGLNNLPRYVDFTRPSALTLNDLRLASGSNLPDDLILDEDAWILDEDEADGIVHIATDSDAEVREPEFFYDSSVEEPDGTLVQFEPNYRTYLIEENVAADADGEPIHRYVTVVGTSPELFKDSDGFLRYYDNTLEAVSQRKQELSVATGSNIPAGPSLATGSNMRRTRSVVTTTKYRNAEGAAEIQIPDEMDSQNGYILSNGEDILEVIPTKGEFKSSVVLDNAIRYSNVFENVDFQYTVLGNSIKEDIILLAPQEHSEFSYRLKGTGLKYRKAGNSVVAYREDWKEPSFKITAPVMIDAAGQMSMEIRLKFDSTTNTVTVAADKEWLEDPDRSYPVRIDPTTDALVGPEAFTVNMVAKGDNRKSALDGIEYDREIYHTHFGDTGHTMVGYSEDYGHCRAVIDINTDWQALLNSSMTDSEESDIEEIQFSIGVLTNDTPNRSPFYLRAIEAPWNTAHATYADICNIKNTKIGESDFSGGKKSRLEYLITDTYYQWVKGEKPCYGLMMEVPEEKRYEPDNPESVYWAETVYNRYGGDNGPRIEIAWTGKLNPDMLINMPMSDFSLDIGAGIIQSEAGGRSTVGILAHGASQAESRVEYTVYKADGDEEVAGGEVEARNQVECPDYREVDPACIPESRKDSNWQSDPVYYGTELELDTLYYVKAKAYGKALEEDPETGEMVRGTEEEESPERTSKEFLLYEVQMTDVLPRIARHYGVSVKQLKRDNKFLEQLTTAGDVLFIREPQTTEPYTWKLDMESIEYWMQVCLELGWDYRDFFDMEPINMANGSFYMSQTDSEQEDLGGSFTIGRSYNSLTPFFRSEFGMGWSSLTGEKIMVLADGRIVYTREDGKGLIFEKDGDSYKAPDGYDYELESIMELDVKTEDGEEEEAGEGDTLEGEEATEAETASGTAKASTVPAALVTEETEEASAAAGDTDPDGDTDSDADGIEAVPDSTGWKISQPDGTVKLFNSNGLLVAEKNRKEHTTYYVYDTEFALKRIITPSGKEYEITQTPEGLITDILLPDGGELHYAYDEDDNLVSVTNPEGDTRTYEYDEDHRMTSWYDENGTRVVENIYDEKGRVTQQTDALGNTATLDYSDSSTVLTDNRRNVTRYQKNGQGLVTEVVYPTGDTERTSYTEDNRIASKTDANGAVTHYSYDKDGNILTETRDDGSKASFTYNELNLPVSDTDYEGNTSRFSYDDKGNLLSMTDGAGNTTHYAYDDLSRITTVTDANGGISTFVYDGTDAPVVSYTDPEGETSTFTYDAMNRVLSQTDPEGNTTEHSYNANGWETAVTAPDGGVTTYTFSPAGEVLSITDAMGVETTFTYDAMHNILSGEDALSNTLTYAYDENYNKVSEVNAKGETTRYTYDARNRVTEITDALGNTTNIILDGNGNATSMTDRRGNTVERWNHKVLNLPTMVRDALGNETYYTYDGNGNVTKITYPDGTAVSYSYDRAGRLISTKAQNGLVTELVYDGNGNIIRITDDETRVYRFAYDGNNRLVKATDPLGGVTAYAYDGAGNQTRVTDANGNSTNYGYDAVGRLKEMQDALGGTVSSEYDLMGRTLNATDQNGNAMQFHYDVIGQVLAQVDAAGNITAMEYDSLGNVTKVIDALKGETAYDVDALSRTVKMTDALGGEYEYLYDENGNLLKITMPDSDTVNMSYDANNRMILYRDEASVVTRYEYDSMGRITKASDTAGNTMDYEYDERGNLVRQTDTIGRDAIYEYDKFGRLVSVTGTDLATTAYAYDALDRLTSVTQADGTVTAYEYDAVGNLIQTTEPGEAVYTYAYDAINRLTDKVNPLGASTTFRYDAKGNLTGSTDGEGNSTAYAYDVIDRLTTFTDGRGNSTAYEYDELSRLLSHTTPEGNKNEYRYDALGRMTKAKDPNGLITEYQYDVMGNLVEAISPKGARTAYTYDKHDELTSVTDPAGNVTRYEVDLNRRVTEMTQKNGAKYQYTYDPVHRLTSITTPLGLKRDLTYDVADNVIKDTDNLDRTNTYEYDIMHRMTKSVNAEGGVTTYGYDIRGNQNQLNNALGYTWNYRYDLVDQLTASVDPEGKATEFAYNLVGQVESITRPGNRRTDFQYDGNYNVTAISDPKGYIYQYAYDKDNRLAGTENPLGETTATGYDPGSRVTSVTDRMGLTESYTYDPHGNVLSVKAANGLVTRFSYDILDNLVKVTMPSNLTAVYTYDVMGNVTSATDTMFRTTRYTYDAEGNMTSITDPAGRRELMAYDAGGRNISYTSNGGNKISYDYDRLNDIVEKSYEDVRDPEKKEGVLYGYDVLGQRVSMMDRSGDSKYEYDALGRITRVTSGSGEVTRYAYDGSDQLESITYADGKKVSYEYDKNDNLTKVTDRTGAETTYVYDAINRVTEIHRPNGVSTYNTYNARDQIIDMKNLCDDCDWVISKYHYTYDDRGFIVGEDVAESLYAYAWDDKHDGKHENWHDDKYPHGDKHISKHAKDGIYNFQIIGTKRTFEYGDDGKMTTATETEDRQGTYVYEYGYDDMGNRTSYSKSRNGKVQEGAEYTYNLSNQMVAARLYDGKHYKNVEYTYDADGNRILQEEVKPDGDRKVELTYDYSVENRLKAVHDKNDLLVAMAYDGDGNRIFQLNYNLHTDDDWKGNSGNGNGNNKDNSGSGNNGNSSGNGTGSKGLVGSFLGLFTGDSEEAGDSADTSTTGNASLESKGNKGNKDKDKGNDGNDKNNGKGNGNGNSGNGNSGNNGNGNSGNNGNASTGGSNDNNGNANGNTNNTGGSQNQSGILFPIDGEISELESELIGMIKTTGKEKNYELVEYVNDVNREHSEVLMELNINGIMDTAYSYGNQRLTNERFTGWTGYYTYDPRGSVTGVTDDTGMIWQSYRYNANGDMTFGKPQYNNVYSYNAESYNPNMESQYLRARYYNVPNGNFLTEDSYLGNITDPLTLNRYNYVKSSPLNYIDPSGHVADYLTGSQSGQTNYYAPGMEIQGNNQSNSIPKPSTQDNEKGQITNTNAATELFEKMGFADALKEGSECGFLASIFGYKQIINSIFDAIDILMGIISGVDVGVTASLGVNLQVGNMIFTAQLMFTLTNKGEYAIDVSYGTGFSTSIGLHIGVFGSIMVSDISRVTDIDNYGGSLGGSKTKVRTGNFDITFGVDFNPMGEEGLGELKNKGVTFTLGIQTHDFVDSAADALMGNWQGPDVEGHWINANTVSITSGKINFEEIRENVLGFIS